MTYKFARFENGAIKRYEFSSYEEIEKWVYDSLMDFKKINKVRDELKDRSYIAYKSELEELLNVHRQALKQTLGCQ